MGFGKRLRDSQTFGVNAAAIAANGYAPLPIWPGQKNPSVRREWQNYRFKEDDLATYAAHGIGILTRNTPAVDIDVRDARIARKVDRLVTRTLGIGPERIGLPPKSLRMYRLSGKPFGKMATGDYHLPGDAPGDKAHKVEILADGQQFVAYNNHKDTGKPYDWNGDGNPLTTAVQDLPPITEQQAKALIAAADRLLAKYGTPVSERAQGNDEGPRKAHENLKAADPQELRAALAHIKNEDLAYDEWINVGLAIKGALGDDGEQDFAEWSALSEKNDPDATAKAWKSFKPDRIGAGTIFHLAKAAGWARPIISEINAKHALVWVGGRLTVMWVDEWEDGLPRLSTINDIKAYWKPQQTGNTNPIETWLRSKKRQEYTRLVFQPGARDVGGAFNLFRGWGVTPQDGDCSLFLAHLEEVICGGDADTYDYVLQWFANMLQTPEDKPGTALTLGSQQGAGKGAIARYLRPILTTHFSPLTGGELLLGRFNDTLAGKLLVFGDESAWPGDRRGIDKLKSYITEERITVERKHVPAIEVDNFARFIFATNRDHSAPAEYDDRRFVPLKVSNARKDDAKYWKRLEAERKGEGPAALLHYLLNEVKLTRNLRRTPKTAALAEQKLLSLDHVGQFVRFILMQRKVVCSEFIFAFGDVVPTETLWKAFLGFAKDAKFTYPESLDAFGTALRRYLNVVKREARKGEIGKGFAQRTKVYALPTLPEAREQFEKAIGHAVSWNSVPQGLK